MGRKKTDTLMRRVNHFLTAEQVERIDALSAKTGRDRSTIIRSAIDLYLASSQGTYLVQGGTAIQVAFLKAPEGAAKETKKPKTPAGAKR